MKTLNVYYKNRIHKGKILMKKNGFTYYELKDPFNWRFGITLIKIKNKNILFYFIVLFGIL